jgi:DNA-directed RNA polymerase subunit H (RpoH/RPB5)
MTDAAAAAIPAFSSIPPGVADIVIRSRQTILDILDERGYDVTPYRNIAPDQILTLLEKNSRRLDIFARRKPDGSAPAERAVVVYSVDNRLRMKLGTFFTDLVEHPLCVGAEIKPTDDIIVLLNEPYNEAFDRESLRLWQSQKTRLVFFHIKQVVVHPGRHTLVPPHRKLTEDEVKSELARLHLTQKSQLPLIKHHDIQSRVLGLVPGDIVEILRPSPTAGVARVLRICAA